MGLTEEYRVDLKIRNNLILKRIEQAGYKTVSQFCRENNLQKTDLSEVISMKRSPLMSNGQFRTIVRKVSDILWCDPEELFSEKQLNMAIKTNKHRILLNEAEMKFMLENKNDTKLLEEIVEKDEKNKLLDKVLNGLNTQEQKVIRLRFGLDDGIEHTLEVIGKKLGVTKARIKKIEDNAVRKLKNSDFNKELKEVLFDK